MNHGRAYGLAGGGRRGECRLAQAAQRALGAVAAIHRLQFVGP